MSSPALDRFDAAADPALPTLALALDPEVVRREFLRLPRLSGGPGGRLRVAAIRVTRHKPGRRCLVEYDLEVEREGGVEAFTVIGKIRVHRFGKSGHRLLSALWRTGFDERSPDGISVPEPIGVVPAFRMWMQRKASGRPASQLLQPGETALARRIAEAARKLHLCRVPAESRHGMADELRILGECLEKVARSEPRWRSRCMRLKKAGERLGNAVTGLPPAGIHRDFYADQVLVDGDSLVILDFDLYCTGDPGLDPGNFLGHVTEQALRTRGDPYALADFEEALEERFVELSGESARASLKAYAALTLARHVYLSMLFPDRRPLTQDLLSLSEERVSACLPPGASR
ncbi:MAG TPA: phosphotransferase [Thermoanaerobaculia bacterium]|nr:phosphotransferase [Thermoanaerobaculia bacterium]